MSISKDVERSNPEQSLINVSTKKEFTRTNGVYLSEDALMLRKVSDREFDPREFVPPHTPNENFLFLENYFTFPRHFPDMSKLKIPIVREVGIKECIEKLGIFFGCVEYRFNLLQFWFLDILTDCIWCTQDEFQLDTNCQRIIIDWILYFIDILRDKKLNVSRKQFFTIFKEAVLTAAEVVEEGCEIVPTPAKLFIMSDFPNEKISISSLDTRETYSSLEISSESEQCLIELGVDEDERRKYHLPATMRKHEEHALSSIATLPSVSKESSSIEPETKKKKKRRLKDVLFYQPDPNIPSRFLPLEEEYLEEEEVPDESTSEKETSTSCSVSANQSEVSQCHVVEVPVDDVCITSSHLSETEQSETLTVESVDKQSNLFTASETVLENLKKQKLWEQRLADMADPRKGWIPSDMDLTIFETNKQEEENGEEEKIEEDEEEQEETESEVSSEASVDREWIEDVINQQEMLIEEDEDKLILNFGVLRAIMELMFKNFYESFQFTLIKLAFHATPGICCQILNDDWKIPRTNRDKFIRPKEQKIKKKPEKKETTPSTKSKNEVPKSASKKSDEKSTKGKKPELTEEEKQELERQKKEKERLEEEMLKNEENKRYMFPLVQAATDDLFMEIFENWTKPVKK